MALSQTTAHNAQSSSPHYDSAGKIAVLYFDLCVALLSAHSSFYREWEELNSGLLWIVPEFHSITQMTHKTPVFSTLYCMYQSLWLTSQLWLAAGLIWLIVTPWLETQLCAECRGNLLLTDQKFQDVKIFHVSEYQQTVTHNQRATVREVGSWDGKPHRIFCVLSVCQQLPLSSS